jgi:hypothetical protein
VLPGENGQQCISDVDLGAVLALYGVHGEERRLLLRLAERQDDPGRWEILSPQMEGPRTITRLEVKATSIVNAEPSLVPGVLQIADYTRVIMQSAHVLPELVERRVEKRMARQLILTKAGAPKFDLILDEIVLRRVVGSHKIMARQLHAILEVAELPNVRLWVVPFELGGSAGLDSPFFLMDFAHGRSVVLLENTTSGLFLEDDQEVDFFRRRGSKLAKLALNPAESIDRVAIIRAPRRRSVVSPVQPGRTERRFLGLMTYPEPKGIRGQQHVRKPAVVFRCGSNALRGPRDTAKSWIA